MELGMRMTMGVMIFEGFDCLEILGWGRFFD